MKKLGYLEIRELYLKHLKENGHTIIPSASIIPENDPTLLFINAGVTPLVPFIMGEEHPGGVRISNAQRCVRTIDLDVVGDNTHGTTFEMLGNWSLGDYFKEEALNITFKFITEKLKISPENIYVSVFEGNEVASIDQESIEIWSEIFKANGIEPTVGKNCRIQPLSASANWWGIDGGGPCGPTSEIFIDINENPNEIGDLENDDQRYIELGNNVFMQFFRDGDDISPLPRNNVDFGGGLDRMAATIQGVESFYDTDIFLPILNKVKELTNTGATEDSLIKSQRIIVDHIKAATWMVADGVEPSNTERGYILRRIIRRAIRQARTLGMDEGFTREVALIALQQFTPIYERLNTDAERIIQVIYDEEQKFNKTIENGLKQFERSLNQNGIITGEEAFRLYETYGFPIEITEELAEENGHSVDRISFDEAMKSHREKSQSASKGMFKGGLADTSEESTKLHTATHLLLAALYQILGDHIYQKGSNITPERLRLDFPNDAKLTPEQVEEVENLVNEQIKKDLSITWKEMSKDAALELVPYAAFADKYGEVVKVYTIGDESAPFSIEICNGPHVESTGKLGVFKIKKQENVGAGIKRIKAILN
jgi:alanyl-tRNA synthetase